VDTLTLQNIAADDETVLFDLFSAVRSEELGMDGWDAALRNQILSLQFDAQESGYRVQFPGAERRLILRDSSPVGWLIVDREGIALHGIDIALLANERSRGLGTRVIRNLQDEAAAQHRPFVITVRRTNERAAALYLRLGFRLVAETELHRSMEWRAGADPTAEQSDQ
jgi:ribosomal protein S18 acetylase RimI-like enzyme